MRLTLTLSVLVAGLFTAASAQATVVQLQAVMDGSQSVPQTPSQGTGSVLFELNTDTSVLTLITGSYQSLIGHLHMAHVHGFAGPGEKGGTLFMLDHTGGMSGSLSLMTNQIQLKDADVQGMLAGLTYVALHTDVFMAGEIRGQIYVIPAPSGLAMLGLLGLMPRRRR